MESVAREGIFPNSQRVNPPSEDNFEDEEMGTLDSDAATDDEGMEDDSRSDFMSSGRRAEEITAGEIQDTILQALAKCPNLSCTLHSLTARVLKELGVLTRGKPREAFERRTLQSVSILEKRGRIETYKAKNRRLRLVSQQTA